MPTKKPTKRILQLGDPLLRKRSNPIQATQVKNKTTQEFIESMIATLRKYEGVGLAAPQINDQKRIIVIENKDGKKKGSRGESFPLTVMVNPIIIEKSEERDLDWEGCLSINNGDILGLVPRHTSIDIEYFDKGGKRKKGKVKGYKARVIQHEIDHLDGVLFFDRMRKKDLKSLTTRKQWEKHHKDSSDMPKLIKSKKKS